MTLLLALCLPACAAEPDPRGQVVIVEQEARLEHGGLSHCVDSVSELPTSDAFDPADPRLARGHLVVVRKGVRRIQHFEDGQVVTTDRAGNAPSCWRVGLGFDPAGHKTRRGDGRTPEGWYRTSDKPWSQFYHAIAVHYPNADDARAGERAGRISAGQRASIVSALGRDAKPDQGTHLGGEILIHGGGSSTDWTLGCVAMNDADLDDLRGGLPADMRFDVLILP